MNELLKRRRNSFGSSLSIPEARSLLEASRLVPPFEDLVIQYPQTEIQTWEEGTDDKLDLHRTCVEAVCVLVQYDMDCGNPSIRFVKYGMV